MINLVEDLASMEEAEIAWIAYRDGATVGHDVRNVLRIRRQLRKREFLAGWWARHVSHRTEVK